MGHLPEAKGRFFFLGWFRSALKSKRSFNMYTLEATKLNEINAAKANIIVWMLS